MNFLQEKKSNQTAPFKEKSYEFNHFEKKINVQAFKKDARMRFRNSKDPLFIAFDFLDRQPLDKLAKDFVLETIHDSKQNIRKFMSFISLR